MVTKGCPVLRLRQIPITTAAPFIPDKLKEQLKVGGKMVIPVNEGNLQRMIRLTRMATGSFAESF
jgi:protein-L-isoaspartate(D-aspartate) O-methyltransferase